MSKLLAGIFVLLIILFFLYRAVSVLLRKFLFANPKYVIGGEEHGYFLGKQYPIVTVGSVRYYDGPCIVQGVVFTDSGGIECTYRFAPFGYYA